MTNNTLVSEAMMARLMNEAESLIANLDRVEPSIGGAEFVRYSDDFARQYEIGRFGRMKLQDGSFSFFAAPLHLERQPLYEYDDPNVFSFTKSWARGDSYEVPVDRLLAEINYPKKIKPDPIYSIDCYEKNLFQKILVSHDLTLVNPSFKSMSNLLFALKLMGLKEAYIMVTSGLDHDWANDIRDFVHKSKGFLQMTQEFQVQGISYLGMNTPLWYPDTEWCRLILSPGIDPSRLFPKFSVEYRENEVVSTYEKKADYEVSSMLSARSPRYVYNPETVSKFLGTSLVKDLYFMESTFCFLLESLDNKKMYHNPWMIDYKGEWVEYRGRRWRLAGGLAYDVEDEGTYLSRRSRLVPPEGYVWAPFEKHGTHWVTYSSLKPHCDNAVEKHVLQDRILITFEQPELISGVREVTLPFGYLFVEKKVQVRGFSWPLDSPSYKLVEMSEGLQGEVRAYMDNKGRIYSKQTMVRDALAFQPISNGKSPLPFFPNGEVHYLMKFVTREGVFISIDETFEGLNFILQTPANIGKLIPSIGMYTMQWATLRSFTLGVADPDYGGAHNMNEKVEQIRNLLSKVQVFEENDPGMTAVQVSRIVGIGEQLAYHILSHLPTGLVWKPGTVSTTQFIEKDQLMLRFVGQVREDVAYYVDGRLWSQVLNHVDEWGRGIHSTVRFPSSFKNLLVYNYYSVRRDTQALFFSLYVKPTRF